MGRKENRMVILLYVLFFLAGIAALSLTGKAELHLALNGVDPEILKSGALADGEVPSSSIHGEAADVFFQGMTFLGEWLPYLFIGILLLVRTGYGVAALAAQGITTIVVQCVKRTVCAPRPMNFFQELYPGLTLPLPENFTPHWTNSFPSGHTACIFAFAFFLIWMTRNRTLKVIYLLVAILVGYSRIYLSQHFALDVVTGSLIGTVSALSMWYLIPHDRKWYKRSVMKSFLKYLEDRNLLLPLQRNHEKRR